MTSQCETCKKHFSSVDGLASHTKDVHPVLDPMYMKPLTVIHEDDALVVVDKPQGMPVIGASPCLYRSNLLMDFKLIGGLSKPIPVHRLHAATGGLLLIAKTQDSEV